jgi:outer membrane immunogenic protein
MQMTFTRTLLLGVAAAGLMVSVAHAADLVVPPPAAAPVATGTPFTFDGFYAGVYGGGAWGAGSWGTVGALVGTNFSVTDAVLGGVELQGGGDWMTGGSSYDAELLARLGFVVTDNVLLYGDAGVGVSGAVPFPVTAETGWVLGGGVEVGVTDNLGIRADLQYGHSFSTTDQDAKATIGLIWHAN